MIGIQIDQGVLQKTLAKLNATDECVGLTMQWLCWDVARLAGNDLIRYSAPWAGNNDLGNFNAQRKSGEGAVATDLELVFAKRDKTKFQEWSRKQVHYMKDLKTGIVFVVENERWNPPDLQATHLKCRNKRGRVWKPEKPYWVTDGKLSKYSKSVRNRVGSLKAGWLPAADYFASKVSGKVNAPGWIRKQAQAGDKQDGMQASGNGQIVLMNTAHHNDAIRKDTMAFIEKSRQDDLTKWAETRAKKIAERFNNSTAQAAPVTA